MGPVFQDLTTIEVGKMMERLGCVYVPDPRSGIIFMFFVGSGSSDPARSPPGTKVSSDPGGCRPGSGDLAKVSCDPGGYPPGSYEAFAAKSSSAPGSDSGG